MWEYRIADVAAEADGKFLVLGGTYPETTIFRVDPADGSRTIAARFTCTLYMGLPQMDLMSNGDVVLGMTTWVGLYDKSLESTRTLSSATVGTGPVPSRGWGIAVGGGDETYMYDLNQYSVYRIDPATGDRTIISRSIPMSPEIGSGPAFPSGSYCGVAVDKSGSASVSRWDLYD